MGTACYIKGADKILEKLEKKFDVKAGETTKDGLLSLIGARCVGSCSLAPIAIYDNKAIGHLEIDQSVEEAQELVKC